MKPLIVIAGPTATGKSDTALAVSEVLEAEIVSADSMQVYKRMDIGTAKPSSADLARIKHHMIDVVEPDFPFNAAIFNDMAKKAINEIQGKGKTPILTGGTGFYINALLYGNEFTANECTCSEPPRPKGRGIGLAPAAKPRGIKPVHSAAFAKCESASASPFCSLLRENKEKKFYREELYKQSPERLFAKLLKIDPEYAETTHMNNVKRVARALEYYQETGEKFSTYNKRSRENRAGQYNFKLIILTRERGKLYAGINSRVDRMVSSGLIEEVEFLLTSGVSESATSMQGLGYKEICAYLNGKVTLKEAIDMIKQGTRRFAKRQVTWFKNQSEGTWLDVDSFISLESIAREIVSLR